MVPSDDLARFKGRMNNKLSLNETSVRWAVKVGGGGRLNNRVVVSGVMG